MEQTGKLVIFSAPSGSGKTTIVKRLLEIFPRLEFSVSATSRAPRGTERDGVDYFFLTQDEFRARAAADEFVEWEEVYKGTCYGTLRSEIQNRVNEGHNVILDIDVKGGVNVKKQFGDDAVSIFIAPPSISELRWRLKKRGSESDEDINERVGRAEFEMQFRDDYDHVVVNDTLPEAIAEIESLMRNFINGK